MPKSQLKELEDTQENVPICLGSIESANIMDNYFQPRELSPEAIVVTFSQTNYIVVASEPRTVVASKNKP